MAFEGTRSGFVHARLNKCQGTLFSLTRPHHPSPLEDPPMVRSRKLLAAAVAAAGLLAVPLGMKMSSAATLPTPDHVIVVVLENHAYSQVIDSSSAPYINSLKTGG